MGLIAVVVLSLMVSVGGPASRADAADLSQFRPGNIISNAVFYDSASMSESQIQGFLQQKVPACQSGYVCLKDFRQATTTRAANAYCSEYRGSTSESAAAIIAKVAAACGINPQVLLVTLQKEQGLVTHTWPSDWRYTIAMGQGCPDTAACDTAYYGFQNQVYGAARQMRVYGQSSYFTWYAPGKTWNIQYHPNRDCGSGAVYIENQATSNLYYYTPYQPNSASLRAGLGEGDACSSYGNRNFYTYFTDWFGSTQIAANKLVRADGDSAVYLISNGNKHHVKTYEDLLAFQSRLGEIVRVSTTYLSSLPTGEPTSRYVHDSRTGTLYLLEATGTKHRFVSAEQVSQFGYSFGAYVNLDGRILDSFPTGPEINDFRRVSNGNEVYVLRNGSLQYVQSMEVWTALASGGPLYAASVDAGAASVYTRGPAALPLNALVRESDRPEVYLTGGGLTAIYVPHLSLAADFGATGSFVLQPGSLAGYEKQQSGLSVAITCGQQSYVPSGGQAVPVSSLVGTGIVPSVLSANACSAMKVSSSAQSAPLFVSVADRGAVYQIESGRLRHITSYDDLVARNGGRALNILRWSTATATWVGYSAPALADKSFAQFVGSGEVYYVDAGKLRHVTTYDKLVSLGGGRVPPVVQVDASFRSSYSFGPAL